ncbi:actin nucleation-promoting factor WAS [Paramormyrops kingsleyae]|uniref:actin nucleation-promoting factor WAS n=1 Tax=Paramormyrops kingsleyae TaxID=1676925 RepID=UPI003B9789BC
MEPSSELHIYSELISPRENALLFALMGPTCSAVACAVAQVYEARSEPNAGGPAWRYKDGGVMCLVRDQTLRSCFLRLYSVKRGKLLWEQELYTTFKYSAPRPFFHSFLADDCQAGLNFADEAEAERFRIAADMQILHMTEMARGAKQLGPRTQSLGSSSSWFFKQTSVPSDVSCPSTTKHSTPADWTHDKGFDVNNLDPALQKLFTKAGIREKHLRDRHSSWLIHSVIEQHGGLDAVRKEMRHGGLPAQTLPRSRGPPSALTLKKGPLPPLPAMAGPRATGAPGSILRSQSIQDLSLGSRVGLTLPIPFSLESLPPPPSVPAPQLPASILVQTGSPPPLPFPLKPCVLSPLAGLQRSVSLAQHTREDGNQKLITDTYSKERDPSSTMGTGSVLSALKNVMKMHPMLFADENGDESKED